MPDGGEHTRDRISCPHAIPMLGGEVIEGQQGVAVLGQALDGTGVLGPILLLEDGERGIRRLAVRRYPDLLALLGGEATVRVSPVPAGNTKRNR